MNLLNILTGGVDKVVDSVGDAIDKLITSDEEKLILKNALEEIRLDSKLKVMDHEVELEKEITARWKSDNENVITRLIRPMTVFWSYFLFTIVLLLDGNIGEFHINQAYVPMLETVLITVTIAFFGSRGVEKITKEVKGNTLDMF